MVDFARPMRRKSRGTKETTSERKKGRKETTSELKKGKIVIDL
jgi:hypothetical protein